MQVKPSGDINDLSTTFDRYELWINDVSYELNVTNDDFERVYFQSK